MSSRASPGGSSALRHALHAPLAAGHGALGLAPARRRRKDDVGQLAGLREEDVLHDQVFQARAAARWRGVWSASDCAGFSPMT